MDFIWFVERIGCTAWNQWENGHYSPLGLSRDPQALAEMGPSSQNMGTAHRQKTRICHNIYNEGRREHQSCSVNTVRNSLQCGSVIGTMESGKVILPEDDCNEYLAMEWWSRLPIPTYNVKQFMFPCGHFMFEDNVVVMTFCGINDGTVPGYIVRSSHNSSPHHHMCTICVKHRLYLNFK